MIWMCVLNKCDEYYQVCKVNSKVRNTREWWKIQTWYPIDNVSQFCRLRRGVCKANLLHVWQIWQAVSKQHPLKLPPVDCCDVAIPCLARQSDYCLSKVLTFHFMMTSSNGNIFRVTGPLRGEFTGHRWIPLPKASDAEFWCILWSAPEQTV